MNTLLHDEVQNIYQKIINQPLVPLTLRIGVAGHRALPENKLDQLKQTITNTYQQIYDIVYAISNTEEIKHIYKYLDSPTIRFISSLAEGADRLCVEPGLIPFKHELAAILPFAKKDYEKDFSPENSLNARPQFSIAEFNELLVRTGYSDESEDNSQAQVIELDGNPKPEHKTAAYNQCSATLVNHCDLLIVVYDGNNEKDRGTSATFNYAIAKGIPIIHISTNNPTQVNLYPPSLFSKDSSAQPLTNENLLQELSRSLLFTDTINDITKLSSSFIQFSEESNLKFEAIKKPNFDNSGPITLEKEYPYFISRIFNAFINSIAKGKKVKEISDKLDIGNLFQDSSSHIAEIKSPSAHHFYAAYLRSDRLANLYGNIHRSAFLLIYVLGALALVTAIFALALTSANIHHEISPQNIFIFVLFELLLLTSVLLLYLLDHQEKYHDRWLDYRCLAELLRPFIYIGMIGKNYTLQGLRNSTAYLDRELIGHHSNARSWIYIYIQTVIRNAGFSHYSLDSKNKSTTKKFINRSWLNCQIRYHTGNAAKMQVIAQRLNTFGYVLFGITLAAILIKSGILIYEIKSGNETSFELSMGFALFATILPILATTAIAIRNHAGFDISAQRSLSVRASLVSQYLAIDKSEATISSDQLYERLHAVAADTIKDATEWLEIYEVKELELS